MLAYYIQTVRFMVINSCSALHMISRSARNISLDDMAIKFTIQGDKMKHLGLKATRAVLKLHDKVGE